MQRTEIREQVFTLNAGTIHNLLFTSSVNYLRDRFAGRPAVLDSGLIDDIVKQTFEMLSQIEKQWPIGERGKVTDTDHIAGILKAAFIPDGRSVSQLEPVAIRRLAEIAMKETKGPFRDDLDAIAQIAEDRSGFSDTSRQLSALTTRVAAIEGRLINDPIDQAKANNVRDVFNGSKDLHLSWIVQSAGASGDGPAPAFWGISIAWETLGIIACDALAAGLALPSGPGSIAAGGATSSVAAVAAGVDGNIF